MDHLDELEAEAIYIMREVAAECEKPVMLYSIEVKRKHASFFRFTFHFNPAVMFFRYFL